MYISVSLVVYFCISAALICTSYAPVAISISPSPQRRSEPAPATINTFPSPQNEKL